MALKKELALGLAAAAVVLVVVAAVTLLGGDPAPAPPALTERGTGAPPPPTEADPPPPPRPRTEPAPPPRPPQPSTTTPGATERPPTASGPALRAQVTEIVARGERAADEAAERAAAGDLARVLADLRARGEAAVDDARALLDASAPPGVQEVGARVLAAIDGPRAAEALAEFACTPGPAAPRLQALRGLKGSALPSARGALIDVARDRRADAEVRAYALDLMRDVAGAEAFLHEVAVDAAEQPEVRAMALDALLALEPARGREALKQVAGDAALAPWLERLRDR